MFVFILCLVRKNFMWIFTESWRRCEESWEAWSIRLRTSAASVSQQKVYQHICKKNPMRIIIWNYVMWNWRMSGLVSNWNMAGNKILCCTQDFEICRLTRLLDWKWILSESDLFFFPAAEQEHLSLPEASISLHGWGGTQWPINPHYCPPLIHLCLLYTSPSPRD